MDWNEELCANCDRAVLDFVQHGSSSGFIVSTIECVCDLDGERYADGHTCEKFVQRIGRIRKYKDI